VALHLSRVGLGCNNFGRRIGFDETRAVVDAALDAGVTHFDTADVYGGDGASERFIGELLEGRRDRVFLATKFGNDMGEGRTGAPEYVPRALDASLARLRTDHVDLWYYHHPDGRTPIAETVGAMQEQVEAGKVRHLAVSNVSVEQLREAVGAALVAAVQNEYSLLHREPEDGVLPACVELGVGFVPYFPLASGLLTGKYRRGEPRPEGTRLSGRDDVFTEGEFDRIEALERFGQERGVTLLGVAIGGLLGEPAVASVIAGATKPEQVRANVAAAQWEPTHEDIAALNEIR
jgi:aryl-alcohol dehydrogenase-like predicted oxidoreductase